MQENILSKRLTYKELKSDDKNSKQLLYQSNIIIYCHSSNFPAVLLFLGPEISFEMQSHYLFFKKWISFFYKDLTAIYKDLFTQNKHF